MDNQEKNLLNLNQDYDDEYEYYYEDDVQITEEEIETSKRIGSGIGKGLRFGKNIGLYIDKGIKLGTEVGKSIKENIGDGITE